jgi:deoxyribodipyrimidine photo-lyase
VGGYTQARKYLEEFIERKLHKYKVDYQSNLSPYLHFGQISHIEVVLEVLSKYGKDENVDSIPTTREFQIGLKKGELENAKTHDEIIEWTDDPKKAFDNGYAGISWCFGTHDRPWKERKIFGKEIR